MTFLVNLRKNINVTSRAYGLYYGEAEKREPLSLKGFARHLAEHGKLATYEMLVLVLQNVVSCMKELICQGQPVKLDGLGTFYPTVETKGAQSVEAFSPVTNILGIHLRFKPEGTKDDDITSRELLKYCVIEMHDLVETKEKYIDGKKHTYQERTPLSTYAIAKAEGDPEPPDDGE